MSQPVIRFDNTSRIFYISLKSSFYAFRILTDGRVVHVGSGSKSDGTSATGFTNLDVYEEPDYAFDLQRTKYELPAYGDISYHDVALKVSFPDPPATATLADAGILPIRDVRLRYVDHRVSSDGSEAPGLSPLHGLSPARSAHRETLVVRLKDEAYEFWASLYYRVTPEYDIVERWIEVENKTASNISVEYLGFGTVYLPNGAYELTRTKGAWAREFDTVKQLLPQGEFILDHRTINTGHTANPFYLINEKGAATETAGDVYFGALAYSGNWTLRFETLMSTSTRVLGGYEPSDFELVLAPGESHRTPAFVHGVSADGLGGASRRLHGFIRDYVLPDSAAGAYRPVLYNGWEATYFDLSINGQIALARIAAEIGVELFCVDDGWFGARRHDRAGLGDWTVSADVFPDGLKPLVDEVRRLGMTFGLWVEPEMINADSDLYRAHPDWVLHFPGRPRTEARNQLILDFGRQEVVEYVFNLLSELVRDNDISFFKWDMNRYASEPGSVAGRGIWRAHVAGVYSIMDRLRAAYPGLDIQSCSGGGGRIDIGILGRVDQVWTSDNTDPVDRVFIEDGFSLAYPARAMESWVTHEVNHQTGRRTSLDLRFDVAMRGALGIGTPLTELSADELAAYKRKIAFYKSIRPVVQTGQLYRLRVEPGVSVWETVSQDGNSVVLSTVTVEGQRLGEFTAPIRLKGLEDAAVYAVTDELGAERGRYTGFQLTALGLPDDCADSMKRRARLSETLLLTKL